MEEECGWDVTTLDVTPKFKPTILADIRQWDYRRYFESATAPDIIWASPPCRTFTVQAWGRHRSQSGTVISTDGEGGSACVRACHIMSCPIPIPESEFSRISEKNPDFSPFLVMPGVV